VVFRRPAHPRADWTLGPIARRVEGFAVHAIHPGPRLDAWTYVSTGCWDAVHDDNGHGLEFVLAADTASGHHVELLAMLAHYHAGPASQRLDHGHTVPIGKPWVPGSACTHALIALPYAYGPELETCNWPHGHIRILAVQPITGPEHQLKVDHGLEALEQRLEDAGANFTNPLRASVV
jgi:hypothetical protein